MSSVDDQGTQRHFGESLICLIMLCHTFYFMFYTLQILCDYIMISGFFNDIFMCVNLRVSVSIRVFLCFLSLFSACFVIFYFLLYLILIYYFFLRFLFAFLWREKKERVIFGWVGK